MEYFNPSKEKIYECTCGFKTVLLERLERHLLQRKQDMNLDAHR